MTDPRPVPAETDRVLAGRYRLVQPIARGGMAEVWEGVDEVLTRPIAVKLLHPQLAADERFRERFRREAIAAARLSHPNVVATFDTGEDGGGAYIVMELVRGRTLRDLLAEGPLSPALVGAIGIQMAEALQHAHDSGLVHRDVKPANILVVDGERGLPTQVKVADFGIARAAASEGADLTQPGTLIGTAKYLPPEQVEGKEPDGRSDIYATGVVLYEALTGRAPFVGDTEMATALAHVATDPMRPRQLRAGIPRGLEAVVMRAMEKEPAARYQSAAELCSALRSLDLAEDDARPSVGRDPTPPAGMAPSFRQTERSWLLPAAVIVVVAVVLGVIGVLLSQSHVAQQILGKKDPSPVEAAPGTGVAPTLTQSFDPQGDDGVENEDRARLATDGDPSTRWATNTYSTRAFGNLKKGVGLTFDLGGKTRLRRIQISSPTKGWSAEIYVAPQRGAQLADWGAVVAAAADVDGDHEFDLGSAEGRWVLVWVTKLGADNRFEAAEVTLQG